MTTVEVIEGDRNTNLVSREDAQIDLFFKIHQKVNSKNEETSKSYSNNLLIKFTDIKELHDKTIQSINSLKPIKSNINVRIAASHNEGESDKFNSFQAFEEHNITGPNPTLDVVLIYTFSIYDKDLDAFENYKVLCQVRSRVAELKKIEKEAPAFLSSAIISSMVTTTARISIEYSDYVKARHFIAMFDEWVRGCDESKNIEFINKLKKYSHYIPTLGRLVIFSLLAYFTVSQLKTHKINNEDFLNFLVVYASVFVIIGGLAEIFLKKLELSIDSYLALSYLDLNKGDAKLIKEFTGRNRKSIIFSILSLVGAISVSVLSKATYDIIKWVIA